MPDSAVLDQVARLDRFRDLFVQVADTQETDSSAWCALWSEPALRAIALVGVPEPFNPYPFSGAGLGSEECGYVLHLAIVERLSRGSASALMALPGASLSTSAVKKLGTEAQSERFFSAYSKGPAWSFFAVTEPDIGSDATKASARIEPCEDGYLLSGAKILIGGADGACSGLVLARRTDTGEAVLAIVAGERGDNGFRVERLPTVGMAGAGLTRLRFSNYKLPPDGILGGGGRIPALMALDGVFQRHRPMVGAFALGSVRGLLDALEADTDIAPALTASFAMRHRALLGRMLRLGRAYEEGRTDPSAVSLFKLECVRLADDLRSALARLAPALMLERKDLRRIWRDCGAFEYMEGTSGIHLLNASRAYRAPAPSTVHREDPRHVS